MTSISQSTLLELSIELAQSVASPKRFDQLLSTIRKSIHCDAVAVLELKGDYLKVIALQGLSSECLGRQFFLSEHPRFNQVCQTTRAVRFPSDSPLPDPYDGLLIDREGDLPVHACMGLPLHFDGELIGVLTLDSLTPNVFDDIPDRTLELVASMASVSLHTALTLELLEQRVNHSAAVLKALSEPSSLSDLNEMIGESAPMRALRRDIELVAPSNYAVLIQGESGTGKELVAHNVHWHSSRNNAPIVYVNCAALPENLIESELFGHAKGAFTGADSQRDGKFLIADGGTLFLDEVGELPLSAQSKLLRVLQSNEIQPVGQDKVVKVDVRIIAATNRDLRAESEAKRFRLDLFHRLNVYPIQVPPLKQRTGDLPRLVGFFLEKTKRKMGIGQLKLDEKVMTAIEHYDWPGNVRELEHFLSRAALKASTQSVNMEGREQLVKIELKHCDTLTATLATAFDHHSADFNALPAVGDNQDIPPLKSAVESYQRQLIRKALTVENGSWSAAARILKTDRANLKRLAKRLGVEVVKTVT